MFRILSLDGGGVKGILICHILARLERILQIKAEDQMVRLADYFDLIAGTSTGGILTTLYLLPEVGALSVKPRPKYSAEQVRQIFLDNVSAIFADSIGQKIWSMVGWDGSKYSSEPLMQIIDKHAPGVRLSQLVGKCLITAYNINPEGSGSKSAPHFFVNPPTTDFLIRDVVRATTAAPTYFPPAEITSISTKSDSDPPMEQTGFVNPPPKPRTYQLIDGGVFANNPSMCAITEMADKYRKSAISEYFVLSVSCGSTPVDYSYPTLKAAGKVGWISPLIDILIDGNSQIVDKTLRHLFESTCRSEQYVRLDTPLIHARPNLDDISPKNLAALLEDVENYLSDKTVQAQMDSLAVNLINMKKYGKM